MSKNPFDDDPVMVEVPDNVDDSEESGPTIITTTSLTPNNPSAPDLETTITSTTTPSSSSQHNQNNHSSSHASSSSKTNTTNTTTTSTSNAPPPSYSSLTATSGVTGPYTPQRVEPSMMLKSDPALDHSSIMAGSGNEGDAAASLRAALNSLDADIPHASPETCSIPSPPPGSVLADTLSALDTHAENTWTLKRGIASSLKTAAVSQLPTYLVTLTTAFEARSVSTKREPYTDALRSSTNLDAAPTTSIWDVPADPPAAYASGAEHQPQPGSHRVEDCPTCHASGLTACTKCKGEGRTKCTRCNGRPNSTVQNGQSTLCQACGGAGRARCTTCAGEGRTKCTLCNGHRLLLAWEEVSVKWTVGTLTATVRSSSAPGAPLKPDQIAKASGKEAVWNAESVPLIPVDPEMMNHDTVILPGDGDGTDLKALLERNRNATASGAILGASLGAGLPIEVDAMTARLAHQVYASLNVPDGRRPLRQKLLVESIPTVSFDYVEPVKEDAGPVKESKRLWVIGDTRTDGSATGGSIVFAPGYPKDDERQARLYGAGGCLVAALLVLIFIPRLFGWIFGSVGGLLLLGFGLWYYDKHYNDSAWMDKIRGRPPRPGDETTTGVPVTPNASAV